VGNTVYKTALHFALIGGLLILIIVFLASGKRYFHKPFLILNVINN